MYQMNSVIKQNNKKAVSPLIAYIILIVIVIGMVPMVYMFLKSWVPTSDPLECPDEVSIFISESTVNTNSDGDNILEIYVKNNGRFNIGGFYFYGSNSTGQGIGTIDLSLPGTFIPGGSQEKRGSIITLDTANLNPFYVGDTYGFEFNLTNAEGKIESIDVIPMRNQKHDEKYRTVTCGNAKSTRQLNY